MGAFDECRDCQRRYPACQDTCPTGVKLKKAHTERQMTIRKAKAEATMNRNYIWEHYEGRRK